MARLDPFASWVALLVGALAAGNVLAAPVTYTFSTSGAPSGGPRVAGTPFVNPGLFAGENVSGTFVYDTSALFFSTTPIGSSNYRGFTPQSVSGFVTALSGLSGTLGARSFADVSGQVEVGDDHAPNGATDFLQLVFDPFTATPVPPPHNLTSSGFAIDGFSLVNVRMLYQEGVPSPEAAGDFLSSQDLPSTLPAFHGRIVFDFALPGENQASSFVFIDALTLTPLAAIPEPEIGLLLAIGLAGLGVAKRRRPRATFAARTALA
jgi:hypothetical protein